MSTLYEWLAGASAWWWPRLADHLWQATLFALLVLAASFAVRRGPARVRHTFWLLASAKFVVPAALLLLFAQQTGIDSLNPFSQQERNAELVRGITEPVSVLIYSQDLEVSAVDAGHSKLYLALSVVWLAGCTALLLTWGMRRRKFMHALKLARTIQHGREWQALMRARASLDFKGTIGLVVLPLKIEPGVWRVRNPRIVLPESVASHLDDSELETIMLHELVHIQRRDNLVGSFQLALCALFWFHPLVWFVSRKLFDEREQACDEKVLEICGAPETYAAGILKVVRFSFGWRVAGVTGAGSGSNLRRRIENIMSTENTKRQTGTATRLLTAGLIVIAVALMVLAGLYSRPRRVEANSISAANANDESLQSISGEAAPSAVDPMFGSSASEKRRKATRPPKPPPPPPPMTPPPPPPPPPTSEAQDKSSSRKEAAKEKQKIEKGGLIEAPNPVYPEEAKKQKVEGRVSVDITIDETGKVISARAASGPELLREAAEEAARKARFRPTTLKGEPVKVSGAMSYNFVLDKP